MKIAVLKYNAFYFLRNQNISILIVIIFSIFLD